MKALTKRSMTLIQKKIDAFDEVTSHPPLLQPIIQPMIDKMTALKLKVLNGENVIEELLQGLPEDKLQSLIKIFNKKGAGAQTEDKIFNSAFIVVDDLKQIDEYVNYLTKVKTDIIEDYVTCYGKLYHVEKMNTVHYDNEAFFEHLNSALSFRKGFRKATASNNSSGSVVNDEQNATDRCNIM